MGHDCAVHHAYYGQDDNTINLTKISRVHNAAKLGELCKHPGKDLDSLGMDVIDNSEESSDDEEPSTTETAQQEKTRR